MRFEQGRFAALPGKAGPEENPAESHKETPTAQNHIPRKMTAAAGGNRELCACVFRLYI